MLHESISKSYNWVTYLRGEKPSRPGVQLNVICSLWTWLGLIWGTDGGWGRSRLFVVNTSALAVFPHPKRVCAVTENM
jgi:hypothetical protein